jgi:hypothetical protein
LLIATPELVFNHHLKNLIAISRHLPVNQAQNFQQIGKFFVFNIFLSLFTVYALSRVYDKRNHPLWLVLLWSMVSFCWLMIQDSPHLIEPAILLPPLAMMAGWGAVHSGRRLRRLLTYDTPWWQRFSRPQLPKIGLGAILLLLYALISWHQLNSVVFWNIDTEGDLIQFQQRPDMLTFIRQQTNVEDCVFIDDPSLSVEADRLPPPWLTGLTDERIEGGLITEAEVQKLFVESGCTLTLFYRRDYHRHLLDFKDWTKDFYPNEQKFRNTQICFD